MIKYINLVEDESEGFFDFTFTFIKKSLNFIKFCPSRIAINLCTVAMK